MKENIQDKKVRFKEKIDSVINAELKDFTKDIHKCRIDAANTLKDTKDMLLANRPQSLQFADQFQDNSLNDLNTPTPRPDAVSQNPGGKSTGELIQETFLDALNSKIPVDSDEFTKAMRMIPTQKRYADQNDF